MVSRLSPATIKRRFKCERMHLLGFLLLDHCSATYYKSHAENICIVYAYVDDFILNGNNSNNFQMQNVHQFRQHASTTELAVKPSLLLGLEIYRDKPRIIGPIITTISGSIT